MRIKLVTTSLLLVLFINKGQALELYNKDNNSLTVSGRITVDSQSNDDTANAMASYRDVGDFGSRIRFEFTNTELESLKVKAVTEWGIDTQSKYSADSSFLFNRESYIELSNANLGVFTIGKFWSRIYDSTVGLTDYANNAGLVAGYATHTGLEEGSDYATSRMHNALAYEKQIGKIGMGLQVQGKEDNLTPRNSSETLADDTSALTRNYSAGAYLRYVDPNLKLGVGYVRVGNYIKDEAAGTTQLNDSVIDANIYSLGAAVNIGSAYLSVSGGYYQNYMLAGVNHLGAATYMSYRLDKVEPYIGYQYVYSPNVKSSIDKIGADVYNVENRSKKSVEASEGVIGITYYASSQLRFMIEHSQDFRSNSQIDNSLVVPKKISVTTLAVRYDI